MTSKKYFYGLLGIFILLIALIIGGAVQGNMLLKKQSQKLTDLKVENAAVDMQQTALLQAKKDVEKYSSLENTLKSVVPQDKDQAKTVREIVQIAAQNNIPINSVTFENSTLGDPKAATGGGAATTQPKTTLSQVKPVEGINGLYVLPIQIESKGKVSYPDFLKFLEALEKNRRTSHVDSINIKPEKTGKLLDFSLTINAYVKPQS